MNRKMTLPPIDLVYRQLKEDGQIDYRDLKDLYTQATSERAGGQNIDGPEGKALRNAYGDFIAGGGKTVEVWRPDIRPNNFSDSVAVGDRGLLMRVGDELYIRQSKTGSIDHHWQKLVKDKFEE